MHKVSRHFSSVIGGGFFVRHSFFLSLSRLCDLSKGAGLPWPKAITLSLLIIFEQACDWDSVLSLQQVICSTEIYGIREGLANFRESPSAAEPHGLAQPARS